MNKKIYYNNFFLEFVSDQTQVSLNQQIKTFRLNKDFKKELKKIVTEFIKSDRNIQIISTKLNFELILEELKTQFQYIEAAGGFIEKNEEYLFIHRHGRWDLPKGKLERNETIEHAAIRECEEECSIKNLNIIRPLSSSFHIYPYKKDYALKQSYWFYMQSNYDLRLIPQLEESIDEVRWFNRQDIDSIVLNDTYHTITDVVKEALQIL